MRTQCHLTFKRVIPHYFARDNKETILKRRQSVESWLEAGIDFFNDCVFIDESGFNRNMHRSYGWSEAG
ncbi:hypothetical protein BCR42DRAFT_303275, partial [Absidia repens]